MSDGIGVLINRMYPSAAFDLAPLIGREVASAKILDDGIPGEDGAALLVFKDGSRLALWDRGRSCCEHRYIVTDDDLSSIGGATFLGIEVVSADTPKGEDGDHEIQFLNVQTSAGVFQFATHNVHNGYYGGFSLTASMVDEDNRPIT